MQAPIKYDIKDNCFWLSVERCLYWENTNTLIASDLHFGKTGHFRKYGIAVPQNVYKEDLHRLLHQLEFFKAGRLVIVGDLFHSDANKEHNLFRRWRKDIHRTEVHLVKGNHDLLNENIYSDLDICLHEDSLQLEGFHFVHDITRPSLAPAGNASSYSFSGHVHPGIRINGPGKQALQFPCFYFARQFAVLPAFSRFTGLALIKPKENEKVFAIVENKLLQIQ
jgi:uncharacterized protein